MSPNPHEEELALVGSVSGRHIPDDLLHLYVALLAAVPVSRAPCLTLIWGPGDLVVECQ